MKVEIISENKNPLLGRKEVEFQVVEKVTPSREAIRTELAKVLKKDEKLIVIDIIDQKTGSNLSVGSAKVYDKEDVMNNVDLAYKNKRGVKKKEEASEATPTERAPAEEKPVEEPKAEEKTEVPSEVATPAEEPKEEAPTEPPKEEAPTEEKPAEEAARKSE